MILMAVPLIRAHGRKNSLRFSAAVFLLLRNKNDLNGRAPHRGTWPKKQPPLLCGYFLLLRNKNDLNGRAPYQGTWPKKQPSFSPVLIRKYFRDDGVASEDGVTPLLFYAVFSAISF